jgi:hypothetical protein
MKAVFFVILCCFLVTATKSYSNSVDNLSDSLHHVIQTQTSHHQMDALLSLIRQNKKKLGENYIPLLKQYAQRAQHITYAKGEMKSYDFIGLEYRYQENFDTAYMYHNKSLETWDRCFANKILLRWPLIIFIKRLRYRMLSGT